MALRYNRMAICYDFDGTLFPGNIQEYASLKVLGMKPGEFWDRVQKRTRESDADYILIFMQLLLEEALKKGLGVTAEDLAEYGKGLEFYKGLDTWFDRITEYGKENKLTIEHYLISSGLHEMIGGTPVAGKFKRIFASSYCYDSNGLAVWPRLAINYTTKTQFLLRINKDVLNVSDNSGINEFMPYRDRPVPFTKMVYIGDGSTDVPCMKLVKEQGGHSIAVYKPGSDRQKEQAIGLLKDGRVNLIASADYSQDSLIETQVKAVIQKVGADTLVERLIKESQLNLPGGAL